jgi:hypothetical protein
LNLWLHYNYHRWTQKYIKKFTESIAFLNIATMIPESCFIFLSKTISFCVKSFEMHNNTYGFIYNLELDCIFDLISIFFVYSEFIFHMPNTGSVIIPFVNMPENAQIIYIVSTVEIRNSRNGQNISLKFMILV